MKPTVRTVFLAILGCMILAGLVTQLPFVHSWLTAAELARSAQALRDQPEARVRELLGPPERSFSCADYLAMHKADIDHSYNPSPPEVDCEEVYQYRKQVRIVLVFLKHGRVVEVYTGFT